MSQGIFSIWCAAFGITAAAWLVLRGMLLGGDRFENRRQISGCELARQVFDRNHLGHISIRPVSLAGRSFKISLDQLSLPERVYGGTHLSDLAVSLHGALHLVEGPRLMASPIGPHGGQAVRNLVLGSLVLAWAGWLGVGGPGGALMGELIFIGIFFARLSALPAEWQVTEKGLSDLVCLEGLGPDELARTKRLFKVLRWSFLAELFPLPFLSRQRGTGCFSKSKSSLSPFVNQ